MNGGNVIDHFARLFNLQYDKLIKPTEPVKIKSCQLYAERGNEVPAGVDLGQWNQHQEQFQAVQASKLEVSISYISYYTTEIDHSVSIVF